MSQVTFDIPDETLLALKIPAHEAADALRMVAAIKLFELGQLSSGAAAHLAGVPKPLFLSRLADYKVYAFQMTEEQLLRETRFA